MFSLQSSSFWKPFIANLSKKAVLTIWRHWEFQLIFDARYTLYWNDPNQKFFCSMHGNQVLQQLFCQKITGNNFKHNFNNEKKSFFYPKILQTKFSAMHQIEVLTDCLSFADYALSISIYWRPKIWYFDLVRSLQS